MAKVSLKSIFQDSPLHKTSYFNNDIKILESYARCFEKVLIILSTSSTPCFDYYINLTKNHILSIFKTTNDIQVQVYAKYLLEVFNDRIELELKIYRRESNLDSILT